jgi:photosystem II stability/assembly factor-like uncharacterized protein
MITDALHSLRSAGLSAVVLLVTLLTAGFSCSSPSASDLQWEPLPGPFALNVSALYPVGPGNLVYAGLSNGEIALSTDAGTTWSYRTPAARGFNTIAFIGDPDHPTGIYAATTRGLFFSADSARTWTMVPISTRTQPPLSVLSFAFDPWKPANRFAGTEAHGIYRSTDAGATWQPIPAQKDSAIATASIWSITVDPGRPDRVLAAAGTLGLLTSSDGGQTWNALARGSNQVGAGTTHLLIHPRDGNILLIGTDAGSIFRTTNAGQIWSPVLPASSGNRIRSLRSDPATPGVVYAGTNAGVLLSKNFGESWQLLIGSLPHLAATIVSAPGTGARLFAFGNAIGLRTSSDRGMTWVPADAYLGGTTASLLVLDPVTTGCYAGIEDGLVCYRPDSSRWTPIGEGLTGGSLTSISIDQQQPQRMYATSPAGGFRSTDSGEHWQPFARSIPSTPLLLVQHPWFHTRMLASTDRGIFNSTDRGSIWKESRPNGKTPTVSSFTFRPTNAGIVYATASPAMVLLTHDGGISWETTRFGLGTDSLTFVTLDPADDQVCYAWTSEGGCYRSLNGGMEWSRFAPPWERSDRVIFATDPKTSSCFVAMVNERIIYLTNDGGTTWTRVFDRVLPGTPVKLAWHAGKGVLVASLRDRGAFRLHLQDFITKAPVRQEKYPSPTDY